MKSNLMKWFVPITVALSICAAMVGAGVYASSHAWSGTASMSVYKGQCGSIDVSSNYVQQGTVTGSGWNMGDVDRGETYVASWTVTNNGCIDIIATPGVDSESTGINGTWDKGATDIDSGESVLFTLTVAVEYDCPVGAASVNYYYEYAPK